MTTVRMISTRFCTGAGLKKCRPMTRPGCDVAAEISVTDSDEVLVARMASAPTIPSRARKISCLTGELLDDRLDDEVAVLDVGQLGGEGDPVDQLRRLLLGELAPLDGPGGGVLDVLATALEGLLVQLDADHLVAVAGEDLGDAGAHRAEADDADRTG